MRDDDPQITIGELGRLNHRLGMNCKGCGRFRYVSAGRYPSDVAVAEIGRRLHCHRCLSTDVEAICVKPDAETGRWPAERS